MSEKNDCRRVGFDRRGALGGALVLAGSLLIIYSAFIFVSGRLGTPSGGESSPALSLPRGAVVESLSQQEKEEQIYPVDCLFVTRERSEYGSGDLNLRIPKLALDTPVQDTVSTAALKNGAGLYDYSPLPGLGNRNVSIAGHRDLYGKEFYYIDKIAAGDRLYLEYNGTEYEYEYVDTKIVEPDDWSPIFCGEDNRLTLTSCDPVGTSDKRIVLTARLVSQSKAEKTPSTTAAEPIGGGFITEVSAARAQKTVVLEPKASGEEEYSGGGASIDASNSGDGYVMVKYSGSAQKVKLQITCPGGAVYTYSLKSGRGYETFPLTAGNGSYTINVMENVVSNQYALALGQKISVKITDPLLPYLYPNQYVNFNSGSQTVKKGAELVAGAADDLTAVQSVYNYATKNISYDDAKAASVQSGYVPNVDSTLSTGRGICFDYAAVMATMLRTQGIPTRLEVGYVSGGIYHAWISVFLAEQGWVDGLIKFDGNTWTLMDPTFASTGGGSSEIMKFIGNGSNYQTKFVY